MAPLASARCSAPVSPRAVMPKKRILPCSFKRRAAGATASSTSPTPRRRSPVTRPIGLCRWKRSRRSSPSSLRLFSTERVSAPGTSVVSGSRHLVPTITCRRSARLERLADLISAVQRPHPVRVGIDGVDGAGKTMLADELVAPIQRRGRPVVRSSVDFFHRPRAQRYQRGRHSPEGYFLDSFDYGGLKAALLNPLGPAGSRRFCRRLFDHRINLPVDAVREQADAEAVLLFDGIFLHRPELLER